MVTTITIANDETGNSQCYRDDEVDFTTILTSDALAVMKVMVNNKDI